MARILVIEDEDHLARGLQFNLEAEGHEVTLEVSGADGAELPVEPVEIIRGVDAQTDLDDPPVGRLDERQLLAPVGRGEPGRPDFFETEVTVEDGRGVDVGNAEDESREAVERHRSLLWMGRFSRGTRPRAR